MAEESVSIHLQRKLHVIFDGIDENFFIRQKILMKESLN